MRPEAEVRPTPRRQRSPVPNGPKIPGQVSGRCQYEAWSLIVSGLAVLVSIEHQRHTAALAKKQLELLLREEAGKNKAHLSLKLVREGKSFRFYLTNVSEVEARDVEMELALEDAKNSPIIASEYAEKFPVKRLPPGGTVSLIAALTLSSPNAYSAVLQWTDPDGKRVLEETYAALLS